MFPGITFSGVFASSCVPRINTRWQTQRTGNNGGQKVAIPTPFPVSRLFHSDPAVDSTEIADLDVALWSGS